MLTCIAIIVRLIGLVTVEDMADARSNRECDIPFFSGFSNDFYSFIVTFSISLFEMYGWVGSSLSVPEDNLEWHKETLQGFFTFRNNFYAVSL